MSSLFHVIDKGAVPPIALTIALNCDRLHWNLSASQEAENAVAPIGRLSTRVSASGEQTFHAAFSISHIHASARENSPLKTGFSRHPRCKAIQPSLTAPAFGDAWNLHRLGISFEGKDHVGLEP